MCQFYLQYLTESDLEPLRLAIDRLEDDPDFIPDTLPQVIQKNNFKINFWGQKNFELEIVITILPIGLNSFFWCSKEPSHLNS